MGGSDRLSEGEFAVDFRVKFSVVSLACAGSDWTEWGSVTANDILGVDIDASGNNDLIFNYQNPTSNSEIFRRFKL